VKSFNSSEPSPLIDKYGANFYPGDPAKVALVLIKTPGNRWRVAIKS
jgi:hypothetical protein